MAITNVDIANKISNLVDKWQLREDQMIDWLGGTATGGTNSDGKYPLTNVLGVTTLVECPAVLANLAGAGSGSVTAAAASATDSAASATASAASATASATSATASNAAKVAAELARDQAQNYAGNAAASALDPALFTSTTKGAVPASGGGTVNYLRADGTWSAPAGGGGSAAWGGITGTLSAQTDLQTALNSKAATATATTGAAGLMSSADKTKLNGIATGATANSTDAALRDRSSHTGTQLSTTISDFGTAAVSAVDTDFATNGVPLTSGVVATVPAGELRVFNGGSLDTLKSQLETLDSKGYTDYMMFDTTRHNYAMWCGLNNFGCTLSGTATTMAIESTNSWTKKRRQRYRNVATTQNQQIGLNTANPVVCGADSWYYKSIFELELFPSGARFWTGVATSGSTVVASDTPTAAGIGLFNRTIDANTVVQMYSSTGAVQTFTPLTVPALVNGTVYIFEMLKDSTGVVTYVLRDFFTSSIILSGTVNTNLPVDTAQLSAFAQVSNGTTLTTANTVGIIPNLLMLRSLT